MPNTPLLIGKGVTALCRNKNVSDAQFDLVEHIFASRGATLRLDEADMNKIIAATSSSPAYIFLMIKAICDGAAAEGIRCDNLRDAVCNMVIGSAELALRSDKSLDELIRMGASIKVEGNTAIIDGVSRYTGASINAPDLRAGAALVIAGLAAEGYTTVTQIGYIQRGYERFDEKLRALGGLIEKVDSEKETNKFIYKTGTVN